MIHPKIDEQQSATPPYFKNWSTIYWIVISNIIIIVFVLYLISNSFG